MHKFFGLISTNTGLKLFWITDTISDTQVNDGTIISPFPYNNFNAAIVKKFAEDPELTKTVYLTPSHLDHFFSNSLTCLDCVKIIFFLLYVPYEKQKKFVQYFKKFVHIPFNFENLGSKIIFDQQQTKVAL